VGVGSEDEDGEHGGGDGGERKRKEGRGGIKCWTVGRRMLSAAEEMRERKGEENVFFLGIVLAEVEESGKKIQCGGITVRSVFFNNLIVTHVIFVT
jgi:hypothetical protein